MGTGMAIIIHKATSILTMFKLMAMHRVIIIILTMLLLMDMLKATIITRIMLQLMGQGMDMVIAIRLITTLGITDTAVYMDTTTTITTTVSTLTAYTTRTFK